METQEIISGIRTEITQEEINKCIKLHDKWILDDPNGVRLDIHNKAVVGLDLSGKDLSGMNAESTVFIKCNLSNTTCLGADLKNASFVSCDLSNIDIRGCVMGKMYTSDRKHIEVFDMSCNYGSILYIR